MKNRDLKLVARVESLLTRMIAETNKGNLKWIVWGACGVPKVGYETDFEGNSFSIYQYDWYTTYFSLYAHVGDKDGDQNEDYCLWEDELDDSYVREEEDLYFYFQSAVDAIEAWIASQKEKGELVGWGGYYPPEGFYSVLEDD